MDESRLEDLEKRIDELEGKLTKIFQVLTRIADEYGVMYSHVETTKLDINASLDNLEKEYKEKINKLNNDIDKLYNNPLIKIFCNRDDK